MAPGIQTCVQCADNFIVNNKYIVCDLCIKPYHLHCAKVKDQVLKIKQDCVNLKWFCGNCFTIAENRLNKNESEYQLNEKKTKEVLEKTCKLTDLIENNGTLTNSQRQWSDVVKTKKTEPLIIKPKNQNQNCLTTKTVLAQKFSPVDINVSVENVKSCAKGSIAIHCNNKESLDNLKINAEKVLGADYEIKIASISKPKIKIINVHEKDIQDIDSFVDSFKKQNLIDGIETYIKILRKYKSKTNNRNALNVIVEISADIFNYLVNEKEKIHIGWNSYRFFEHVNIIRCFRCWKFGHFADKCTSQDVCPLCGGQHKKDECRITNDNFTCVNCKYANEILKLKHVNYNHNVFDRNCSSYQRQLLKAKERIGYNI
uniref:Uncharacterized protein LOC114340061 n=1 Tax=Diabrotica virgifera virgifera TaxID=50390 RepID=A0A6P7GRZ8_DIAVI